MSEISLQGLALNAEERSGVATGLKATSAIQQVSPQITGDLPLRGISEFSVGRVQAKWTGEGQKKVASGSATKVEIKPAKLTAAVVETLEASIEKPEIVEALLSTAPSAFAEYYDYTILGIGGIAVPNSYFSSLAGSAVVNVTEEGDLIDAQAEISAAGGDASAFVLTTAAYFRLRRLKNTNGTPVFPGLLDRNNLFIDDLPVRLVRSNEVTGVLGDFAGHSKWGVAVPEFMQVKNAGEITDVEGQVHNLTDENKIAYIVETFVAFGVDSTDYFRKLTFDAPAA